MVTFFYYSQFFCYKSPDISNEWDFCETLSIFRNIENFITKTFGIKQLSGLPLAALCEFP